MTNNINIKKISWDKELTNSRLEFNIAGKDIDNVIVNTLRRVCITDIPVYAFTNINITENTSIFNNNYIKLRFRNFPVLGIKSESPFYVEKEEEKNTDVISDLMNLDDINLETNYDVSSSNLKQLTLYLDKENKTKNIIIVGTDDCKFYYKEKEIKSPYKVNLPLIKLQEGQRIKMTAISELGIEEMDALYSPASVLFFKKISVDKYLFIIESRGQLKESTILNYGIENILRILDNLQIDIDNIGENKEKEGTLEIENYDHSMGNVLSQGLRKHTDVVYAGYSMPHLLEDKINIKFKIKKGNIKSIIKDVIDYYKNVFIKLKEKNIY